MDNTQKSTFGSLFSGGGGLDLGLERAGLKCVFQVENDRHCLTLLKKHWPDVPKNKIRPCLGLVGGDPCPIRSSIGNLKGANQQPDMSGYFLAMVARCKPRWILRENVVAPDVVEFTAALEVLGYRSVIIEADSAAFTGQSRRREFVVGFGTKEAIKKFSLVVECKSVERDYSSGPGPAKAVRCITTRGKGRNSIHDDYIYEGPGGGLRCFTHTERELLQGWPIGWTDGLPNSARERITGNGVTSPVAEFIGKMIIKTFQAELSPNVQQKPSGN